MNSSIHFQKVIDIGRGRGLTVSYPKTGSENPEDAKLLLALNYEPIRDDRLQPYSRTQFYHAYDSCKVVRIQTGGCNRVSEQRVIIIDRSPYKHRYLDVQADKAGYSKLLSLTDELMAEVFDQVFQKRSSQTRILW